MEKNGWEKRRREERKADLSMEMVVGEGVEPGFNVSWSGHNAVSLYASPSGIGGLYCLGKTVPPINGRSHLIVDFRWVEIIAGQQKMAKSNIYARKKNSPSFAQINRRITQ